MDIKVLPILFDFIRKTYIENVFLRFNHILTRECVI